MSDFLSKFNKDKYDDLVNEKEDKEINDKKEKKVEEQEDQEPEQKQEKQSSAAEMEEAVPERNTPLKSDPVSSRSSRREDAEEEVEIDLDYRKKKRLRMWLIISGAVLACMLIFFIYYMLVHVKLEKFVDKPVAEARAWAKENDVEIELTQEYSMEHDANQVISQSVSEGDKIRKGKTLQLTSSLGADPEEVIPLVDFSEMSQTEAESWIEENKAENLQIVTEYNDDIEEGIFIKFTIKDSGIEESEYQRKDSAAVYYSRGKEVFEKNITIPDFTGTTKEEVEKWVETNEIDMTYEEADSDSVEAGNIISQSEAADEKIAKRDKMKVVVSLGKATVVPNFGELTAEEAAINYPDINVTVRQAFHADIAYGKLISQSVETGTKLTEKDDKNVTVTYSQGRPYLHDFRGQLEGDLPRLFYEQYQSKGADINYIAKYVYSPEVKGTVVDMHKFNEFVPMKFTVEVHISNNTSAPPNPPAFFEDESDGPITEGEPDQPLEEEEDIGDYEK
ncbi:PASTA domain-containing protein [Oceanobacillus polygoni]|uniref:Serine/threonine-protein kinase n=1 Tax=Oceanobacillus polygoni TaxID=1235259 RepID=A0A9X0YTW2_9BACI|nr:PASTA domain-containing protein [Oceanobacillus polygoni]MBP2078752.1 serine/threonine-protein kinase [Oceanobacillus polygoni]